MRFMHLCINKVRDERGLLQKQYSRKEQPQQYPLQAPGTALSSVRR